MSTPGNSLNIKESGLQSFDGVSVFHGRTLTAGAGISISNGNGVSGNPVISNTGSLVDLHTAKYIVSAGGATDGANYTTISAAMTAAIATGSPQTIVIQSGTYTENLTLSTGIDLVAYPTARNNINYNTPNVIIVGKLIDNGSAVKCQISGLEIQTNSDYAISLTAASSVTLQNCLVNGTNNTPFNMTNGSANIACFESSVNLATTGISLTVQTAGDLWFYNCKLQNNGSSTTATTISDGILYAENSIFQCPLATSSTGLLTLVNCIFGTPTLTSPYINQTWITTAGTGNPHRVIGCYFNSGSATAISIGSGTGLDLINCTIYSTNTNAISGAGTVFYSGIVFSGSSTNINTTNQTPLVTQLGASKLTTPGAYPYTATPQDGVILVDTSAARTINLPASPATGLQLTIKDNAGSAAANNITVSPAAGNIDGSASLTMNVNFGSATLVYNGTQWNII